MQLKNYMGLGILFQGVDDGLSDALDSAISGFDDATESINNLGKASEAGGKTGGPMAGLIEGFQLLSIGKIGSQLEEISQGMSGTDKTFSQMSVTLDNLRAKFSQAVNPDLGNQLNSAMLSSIKNMAVSAEQADVLAMGMTDFGRGIDDAVSSLPFMSELVGIIGLDAGKVSEMFGQGLASMKATPAQMKKLVKETIKLGKSYNLTGQVEILPELFASVTKNAARFGQVNADAAIRSTMGLSRMVAAFRKVGKSQQEAVGATVGFNDKIAEIGISMRRFDVGLGGMSEEVLRLEQAMTEAGIADPLSAIRAGIKNPSSLLDTLGTQIEGLGDFQKTRVTELLRDVFGDDVTNLLSTYREEAQGAIAEAETQANKLGSADVEFDKLSSAMRGTLGVQQQMHETAKEMLQVQIDFATKTEILQHLAKERKAFSDLGEEISDSSSALGWMVRMLDLFKKGGLDAVLGTILDDLQKMDGVIGDIFKSFDDSIIVKLSVMASMLGSLLFPLASLVGLFHIFGGSIKQLLKPFGKLGSLVLNIVKSPFKIMGWALSFITKGFAKLALGVVKFAAMAIWPAVKALLALGAAMLANPVGLMIAGFALLGAAVVATIVYWDDIKKAISDLFEWLPKAASEAWESFTGFFDFEGFKMKLSAALNFVDIMKEMFDKEGASGVFDFLLVQASRVASKIAASFKRSATQFMRNIPFFSKGEEEVSGAAPKEPAKEGGILSSLGSMFGNKSDDSKDNLVPDNVIQFPDKGFTNQFDAKELTGSMANFVKPEHSENVIPMMEQRGAPSRARMPLDVKFEERRTVGDENFQAVIDELRGLRTSLVEALGSLSEQELKVELQGDIKKLLREVNKNGKAGAFGRGLAHAVNR